MTDDDRHLADRLRRYESRVPVDADAPVVIRPRTVPWAALAGVAAVLVLAVVVATNLVSDRPEVGEASPTATSSSDATPSASGQPVEQPEITAVALDDTRMELTVEFGGWMAECVDYRADASVVGTALEVSVTGTWIAPGDGCRSVVRPRTASVRLAARFLGTEVIDVTTGRVFEVPPPDDGASADPSPSEPAATPAPTPVIGVAGVDWDTTPASTIDGSVRRITSLGGRFYALGSDTVDGTETPAIWSSADGTSWDRSLLPRPVTDLRFASVSSLVAVDGRLIAIGAVAFNDYGETIVWESTDGRAWSLVDTGGFQELGLGTTDASSGPGGIVVTTNPYDPTADSVWRSKDQGRTWTEHRPPGDYLGLGPVVGTRTGYVLGGGVFDDQWGEVARPAIWTSTDGTNWRAASVEGGGGQGWVDHVTVDGSGTWTALGALNGRTVIWRSTDRERWTVTADLGPSGVAYSFGYELIGAPDGFIAFHALEPSTTWTSDDGISWSSESDSLMGGFADPSETGWSEGIARIGDRLMVVGSARGADGPMVWVGEIRR